MKCPDLSRIAALAVMSLNLTLATTPVWAQSQSGPEKSKAQQPSQKSGTGFVVSAQGHILTNAHVVEGCSDVVLYRGQAVVSSAKVTARDERNDLALISSGRAWSNFASFRRNPIRAGEDIVALGYPYRGLLAAEVNVSSGIVSALAGLLNDTSQLQISAPVQPGNSGGPIIDRQGTIAGVVVSKLDALAVAKLSGDVPQNVNFGIKGELAAAFLRGNSIEPRMQAEGGRTLSVADVAEAGKNFTLLIECDPNRLARERAAADAALAIERQRLAEARDAQVREEQRAKERVAAEQARIEADRKARERAANEQAQRNARNEFYAMQQAHDKGLRFAYPLICEAETECKVAALFDHGGGVDFMCGTPAKLGSQGTTFAFAGNALRSRGVSLLAAADGVLAVISDFELAINHDGGWWTKYRTKGFSNHLAGGQKVAKGQVIGSISNYPLSPGLDFVVERMGVPIDPFRENHDANCRSERVDRWERGQIDNFKFQQARSIAVSPSQSIQSVRVGRFGITEENFDQINARTVTLQRRLRNPKQVVLVVEFTGVQSGDFIESKVLEPSGKELSSGRTQIATEVRDSYYTWRRLGYLPYLIPAGEYRIVFSVERRGETIYSGSDSVTIDSLIPSAPKGSERMTNEGLQKY